MDRREDAGEAYPGGGFAPASGGARPDAIAELAAEVEELAGEVEDRPTRAEIDAGWWSEWTILRDGVDVTSPVAQPEWSAVGETWRAVLLPGETIDGAMEIGGYANSTELEWKSWEGDEEPEELYKNSYTATRHRVAAPVPTKPSDIGAEAVSNKVTSISQNSTDVQYPSAKCVYDIVGNIESALNTINNGSGS